MAWLTKRKRDSSSATNGRYFAEDLLEGGHGQREENGHGLEHPQFEPGHAAETTAIAVPQEPAEDEREQEFQQVKSDIHRQVIGKIDLSLVGTMKEGDLRFEIRRIAERLLQERPDMLNLEER